jgi:hypothetical protein
MTHKKKPFIGLVLTVFLMSTCGAQTAPPGPEQQNADAPSRNVTQAATWDSPARLRHGMTGGTSGTLRADSRGIEFVPRKGASMRWTFTEIKDLDVERHRIVLVGYDNRGWHLPGTRRFDLKIQQEIAPAAAALITEKMGRPVQNRIPDPHIPAIEEIAVRRSKAFGSSNGLLRIRGQGLDYITAQPGQSRSWRWMDIQTLANPDPYHLFVFGYLDSYVFDLKQALSRDVFNHLSDEIWTHNEGGMRNAPVTVPSGHAEASGWRKDE